MSPRKRLGEILIEAGVIDEFQLRSALGFQKKWGGRLGRVLVEHRFITEARLIEAIQQQTGIAAVHLGEYKLEQRVLDLIPADMASQHHMIPIGLESGAGQAPDTLIVAMSDPTDLNALDDLRFKTGKRIKAVLAGENELELAIHTHYRSHAIDDIGLDTDHGAGSGQPATVEDLPLVEGKLELEPDSPGGFPAAVTAPHGFVPATQVDDPFAELEALADPNHPELYSLPPATPTPAPDPFQELSVPGSPTPKTAGVEDGLDELEILEDFGPDSPSTPEEPTARLETAAGSPAMQALLSRVGLDGAGVQPSPARRGATDSKSHSLVTALIRLLIRKGLISEEELLQEHERDQ